MRLLSPDLIEPVFLPMQGKAIGYVRSEFGNVGDCLIHRGTLEMFQYFGIDYTILNTDCWGRDTADSLDFKKLAEGIGHVVLFGGGSIGYPASRMIRQRTQRLRRPMTLLPQSAIGHEHMPYEVKWAREPVSARLMRAGISFDLALFYDAPRFAGPASQDIGVFLRNDQESLHFDYGDFMRHSKGDPALYLTLHDGDKYLARASDYATIITDRLHFAIAGLTQGRRVILLPNSYHKNDAVFNHCLRELGCLWANNLRDAEKYI